jgi:hypothetical protein
MIMSNPSGDMKYVAHHSLQRRQLAKLVPEIDWAEPSGFPEPDLRRLWRWVRAHEWPARAGIITEAVAVAYLIFIMGLLLGVGLAGLQAP